MGGGVLDGVEEAMKAAKPISRRLTNKDIAVRALYKAASNIANDCGGDFLIRELMESLELVGEAFGKGLFIDWQEAICTCGAGDQPHDSGCNWDEERAK